MHDPLIWLLAHNMKRDGALFNPAKIGEALLIDDDTRAWMFSCDIDRNSRFFNSTQKKKREKTFC